MKTLIFIMLLVHVITGFSQTLTINVIGLRNSKGLIQLTVYEDKKTFEDETPFRIYEFEKKGMLDGQLCLTIHDLECGAYGIAMVDDENRNHQLDRRFLVPTEGFGFSNLPFKERRKPNFDDFSFILKQENANISIEVFYFGH